MTQNMSNPLSGRHVRVFMNYEQPFVIRKADLCDHIKFPEKTPLECLEGMVIDLLGVMASHLNFKYDIYFPADGQWGGIDKTTGDWNGCIRHLLDDEGDLIVASMSINSIRSTVCTFSNPYHFTGRGFMLKNDEQPIDYFRFIKPFTSDVWFMFLGTLFGVSIFVNLINRLSPFDFHGHFVYSASVDSKTEANMKKWRKKTYIRYKRDALAQLDVQNSFWTSFAAIFHVGWWIGILILTSTYTANLTAWLTQARLQGEIQTVADLLNNPSYTYGILGSTGTESAFKRQQSEVYKSAFKNMEQNGWIVTDGEAAGVAKVQDGKYAFFLPRSTIMSYNNKLPCNTRLTAQVFDKSIYGVAMQKGAPWLKIINTFIVEMGETGVIRQLEDRWFIEKGECQNLKAQASSGKMRPSDMTGVMMVIYGSMGLGLILTVAEKYLHRSAKKGKTRLKNQSAVAAANTFSVQPRY